MHRGVIAAAVTGLCWSALFACSGNDPDADPTPPPTTTSVTLTSPSTTPPTTTPTTPTDPTIPPLARQESVAGAKAYVRVFVREMNTAWKTTQTHELRRLFAPSCGSCKSIADGIDSIRKHGGSTEGAIWSIAGLTPIPLQPKAKPIVHAAIQTSAGKWKPTSAAKWRPIPASTAQWDFHLVWTGNEWLIQQAVSQ